VQGNVARYPLHPQLPQQRSERGAPDRAAPPGGRWLVPPQVLGSHVGQAGVSDLPVQAPSQHQPNLGMLSAHPPEHAPVVDDHLGVGTLLGQHSDQSGAALQKLVRQVAGEQAQAQPPIPAQGGGRRDVLRTRQQVLTELDPEQQTLGRIELSGPGGLTYTQILAGGQEIQPPSVRRVNAEVDYFGETATWKGDMSGSSTLRTTLPSASMRDTPPLRRLLLNVGATITVSDAPGTGATST
jgi:hypothetical protein